MSAFGILASGLTATQTSLADAAANLANRNTDGYGALQAATANRPSSVARPAQTVLEQTGLRPDLLTGNGVALGPSALQWSASIQPTGIPTNLAVRGAGFFAVTPSGGGVAYTRNGAFTANAAGQLALPNGAVLAGLHRAPPGSTVHIAADGQVTAVSPQGTLTPLGTIRLATFANASGLAPQAGTLYTATAASGRAHLQPATATTLVPGAVNGSGVSLTQSLTALIADQTAYGATADALKVEGSVAQTTDSLHI